MLADAPRAFAATLRRFQRRLRLVAFVRTVPITGATALGVIVAAVLTRRLDGSGVVAVCAGSLALAIVAAYGFTILSVPSLAVTARLVDRELKLQDRATSALAFSAAADAMSRLVVADATRHLDSTPVSCLPFTVPARTGLLFAAAVAVSALVFVPLARSTAEVPPLSTSSSTTSPGRAADGAGRRAGRAMDKAPASDPGSLVTERRDSGSASDSKSRVPTAQTTTVDGRSTDEATRLRDPNAPAAESGAAEQSRRPSSLSPDPLGLSSAGTGSTSGSHAPGDPARGSASALSAPGRGAGRADVGTSTDGGGGRHGVSGDKSRTAAIGPSAVATRQTAAYATAYGRAESATPSERVPADLRAYVRAYFLAIRPGQ